MSRGPRRVEVEARAKLNLGLAVGPRRGDGFHELVTVFQSVTLADTLIARRARSGFRLEIRYEDASLERPGARSGRPARIGAGPGNLVLRAAHAVAECFALEGGARFTLIKRIPAEAGLGGGSADAAATFSALRRLYGIEVPDTVWPALAATLGSDVPFAVSGGTALGRGRGERLTTLALERPFEAVIALPRWRISTRDAFRRIARRGFVLTEWRGHLRFARDIVRGRVKPLRAMRIGNSFEAVLGTRQSDLEDLRRRLLEAGAAAARMTGSGSAVFAIPGPLVSARDVANRFAGSEPLYLVRSARAGLRLTMQP